MTNRSIGPALSLSWPLHAPMTFPRFLILGFRVFWSPMLRVPCPFGLPISDLSMRWFWPYPLLAMPFVPCDLPLYDRIHTSYRGFRLFNAKMQLPSGLSISWILILRYADSWPHDGASSLSRFWIARNYCPWDSRFPDSRFFDWRLFSFWDLSRSPRSLPLMPSRWTVLITSRCFTTSNVPDASSSRLSECRTLMCRFDFPIGNSPR